MRKDVLLAVSDDMDLRIEDGDFVVGTSDAQNVRLIMEAVPGQIRQYPLLGVGIVQELNATVDGALRRRIQLQLQSDGYRVTDIIAQGGKIGIQL